MMDKTDHVRSLNYSTQALEQLEGGLKFRASPTLSELALIETLDRVVHQFPSNQ